MKKGRFKSNFLFIVAISIIVIVIFSVGFATFYKDSSLVFNSDGYIINATENSSDSYSFASGTKYKTNLNNDIAFEDTNNKSVSVDSASFVHYTNGSLSFLRNGALMDLDEIDEEYVPYYNISNKFLINYENGKYSITNDTKSLEFTNWIGRISDDKYIVVGENLALKIPGVTKTIEGDYFELLFMTDGVVKIDNQDVSYQVTAQDSTIYVGDNIRIDLGEGQIFHGDTLGMLLSQITISGDENIDLEEGNGGAGGSGGGSGDGSGVSSGVTSGTTSGVTSGTGTGGGSGDGSGTATSGVISGLTSGITSGTGGGAGGDGSGGGAGGAGDGSGEGAGSGDGSGGGSGDGVQTTSSATIELIKMDVTSTSMYATLQMNRSSLIEGSLVAYLTDISTGERVEVSIAKKDGTLYICSSGADCYSFDTPLIPDNQYLLSIIDVNSNRQYFQKLIATSELGVNLEKLYTTSSSFTYDITFSTNTSVSQLDFYVYDNNGKEVFKQVGIKKDIELLVPNLKAYSSYQAVIKNVSVCDENDNCSFNDRYEFSRTDVTLKSAPVIESTSVKKNVDSATFDLSATVKDDFSTITKYVYTICEEVPMDEEVSEQKCFTKEKTDGDALSLKVGSDIDSGVSYIYTFKVQYNDSQMEREVISNETRKFIMESAPYFQLVTDEITPNSITGKLSLVDPSCTVPLEGRRCRSGANSFVLRYYKLVDGEEKKTDITLTRADFKYDDESELYYYDLNLTNLASETKYVIKVYGTYILNGVEYSDVQIGDEMYAETASTGNLKFIYTANDSSDEKVINYNAGLNGGSDQVNEGEETAISALNSIEKLTFDLYAGTYADDSETNNRHLGEQLVMTGNADIRKNFCNTDVTSDVCNVTYNFSNLRFGINTLDELMAETGKLNNFCTPKESFGCLATSYTVVVKGYDEAGNAINIDNNTYIYNVTPSYYVTTQLKYHTDKKSIIVDEILKGEFKEVDEDGKVSYNFDEIIESVGEDLTDETTYTSHLEAIDDATTVGIQVFASIPQTYINAAYKYDKVVTNYYICAEEEENCNAETALETASIENIVYSDSNHIFYLNDSDFVRGKYYNIKYDLVFTATDGVLSVYSNEYTTMIVPIKRQAPIYNFYIRNSSANSISYAYNIKDVDSAINENEYFFYYQVDGGKVIQGDAYNLNQTSEVTFKMCEETCNGAKYRVYLKEKILGEDGEYVTIENNVFDGEYSASETDMFELFTFDGDNRLYIKLNDAELGGRTSLYRVKLTTGGSSSAIYDKYYIASKLSVCSVENQTNDSIMCKENPGDYKYITVDYEKIANSISKDISVAISSYYDSGLIGIWQTFNNGLLLQNSVIEKNHSTKYLNVYYNSGLDSSGSPDVIYKVSEGSWAFGNDNKIGLYNILDLRNASDYNGDVGASLFTGNKLSVDSELTLTPLTSKVGFMLGNYSNYNPKVVHISEMKYDDNTFKFDSIIPRVEAIESRGINSIDVDFGFDGFSEETLKQQFKEENGKYYLYVNLYDENGTVVSKYKDVKVEITLDADGVANASVLFTDLGIKTKYKYDIWAYMKSGDGYEKVQVYDKKYPTTYVKTTYETSTVSEDELLSKVVFKANAVRYNNVLDSISDKKISYNVNVSNGRYLKIRLELFDKEGNQVKFDGTSCSSGDGCYLDIVDENTNSIDEVRNTLLGETFNNNTFVFGDNYYTLKVYAIPYYSDLGYDMSKKLTLYDKVLVSKTAGKEEIDVGELQPASFNVQNFESGYEEGDVGYFVSFSVGKVSDPDYVMKNGEYHITLSDSNGNIVYTVKNENGKTVRIDARTDEKFYIDENNELLHSENQVNIKFPKLNVNTQYSIELSYETYRNNISFGGDEAKKTEVNPYIDYIYTPINEGITLGNVIISKQSDTSFRLEYIGSKNLDEIKRVDYKVVKRGSTYSASGSLTGSIFTQSGNNYALNISFLEAYSDNKDFKFEAGGAYNISITYYGASGEKIHSSTFSILV